ncbi:hypothetical protein BDR26DRAFT_865353 [Obelidium mucronatum]|nr:hypothetical protein BDR26DRAFT_865353 [Obelidium mucronatum]
MPTIRQFLRVAQKWPKQEDRANRLYLHLKQRIRTDKLSPAEAQKELDALTKLATGHAVAKFPLKSDSLIPTVLPPRSSYQLLNLSAQDSLSAEKVSTLNFFPTYVWGSLKRMMR